MRMVRAFSLALVAAVAHAGAVSASPREQSKKTKEVAQSVYQQGVDHYRAGRLVDALAAFRASYQLVASPNSHLMLARALRDRGELIEAYEEYEKLVVEADDAAAADPKYEAAAKAARAERTKLRARLTMVTVEVKNPVDDVHIVVGGRAIERRDWGKNVAVPAGSIVARAKARDRPEQRRQLDAIPGGDLLVTFDLAEPAVVEPAAFEFALANGKDARPQPSPFPSRDGVPDIPRQPAERPRQPTDHAWTYVSFGVAGAGLTTFVVFGAIDQSIFADLHRDCPGGHCPPSRASDIDRGRQMQLVANIGFGTALVGITLGCVLLANGASGSGKPDDLARRARKLEVTELSIDSQGVRVGGEF